MILKKYLMLILIGLFLLIGISPSMVIANTLSAPDFTAIDEDGIEFSLSDYKGEVVILHITGLETPLCIECLDEMTGQLEELEHLSNTSTINILTINLRKNLNSDSGLTIARRDHGINVNWRWVEDFNPYPIAGLYQEYWTVQGAFSNPTIILIDQNQSIVGVYHVYCLGKGKIDDIQTSVSLEGDVQAILDGSWENVLTDDEFSDGITFVGIFGLGILTALSPCSIALLVAMISYVGTLQKKNEEEDKKIRKISLQGLWIGIMFTLGMAFVFFIFGLIISSVSIFIEVSALFYLISGIILLILGINVFKPLKEFIKKGSDSNDKKMVEKGQKLFFNLSKKSIYLGAFFLGILFSIGWAPCAISLMMPVFILMLSQKIPILLGGLMLFVFGLGHGIPIIPLCAVTRSIRGSLGNKYVKAGKWMQRIFGLIIILIGIIMAIRFRGINFW